ncbi:MAG: hypothetical protein AABW88_04470 [Nanoarchaeota archaeon]
MTYEPEYQSSWPRKEDARPKGIRLSKLEADALLFEDSRDPMEAEDLKETRDMIRLLKTLRTDSI